MLSGNRDRFAQCKLCVASLPEEYRCVGLFLGDDFMVTSLYLAVTCLLVLPVVSGSTVDTFLRQSTVAFRRDASEKC